MPKYEPTLEDLHTRVMVLEKLVAAASMIGVDFDMQYQSQVIIVSRLNDGQVRIIPAHFKTIMEMQELVDRLTANFQHNIGVVYDMPPGLRRR